MGAKVTGYALPPNTTPNLYDVLGVDNFITKSHLADIRNFDILQAALVEAGPDLVIHMAAQPLVRYSYENPIETYATNIMGTVHLLESLRAVDSVRAALVVTTDKCYENVEKLDGYCEGEPMGGYDPYSSSKACAELVTAAYRQSYFPADKYQQHGLGIATARAGNVIGGGDWSEDRLIPDAIQAFKSNQALKIRNPLATRPWQHVLEPLSGYLVLAQALYQKGSDYDGAWNFGPQEEDAMPVKKVVDMLISKWGSSAAWVQDEGGHPHEAHSLKLNISKAANLLGWAPKWSLEGAIEHIISWQHAYQNQQDMKAVSLSQIQSYCRS